MNYGFAESPKLPVGPLELHDNEVLARSLEIEPTSAI